MKAFRYLLPAVILALIAASACEPIEKVNDVPEVKFKSFALFDVDTLGFQIKGGELVFSFVDGNANFGVIENSDDSVNLFLDPFKKVNMQYVPLNIDTFGRRYAVNNVQELERVGQYKTIRGEIKLRIYYFTIPPFDTIRYNFYIIDRSGNMSNVDSTSDITFK